MGQNISYLLATLFIIAFIVDISINLRRVLANLEKIWRKLADINDTLQKR